MKQLAVYSVHYGALHIQDFVNTILHLQVEMWNTHEQLELLTYNKLGDCQRSQHF